MLEYERLVAKDARGHFETVITKLAAERPGSINLVSAEPVPNTDRVRLVIGYAAWPDLFVLGFLVAQAAPDLVVPASWAKA